MIKKKRGLFVTYILVLCLGLILSFSSVLADENSSNSTFSNISSVVSETTDLSKSELAFSCLIGELKSDCSGATTIQQLAFSILASPENITGKCVTQLLAKRKSEGCFGEGSSCGIKETAWAILALNHVGKNTTTEINWLIKQNKTSSDVEWFLQQDSIGDVNCRLKYSGADYNFNAKENKKLAGNIGSCFNFAQSNYWLRLNENCFDTEFLLSCDKEFFAGWHYKSLGSPILNVLSETKKTAANQEVKLMVDSKCFGSGSGCSFEDTAWAVIALKDQLKDIKPYVPYLISAEDSNSMYLPAALNYLVLEYSTLYGTKLIQQQKSGTYWEADNSAYGAIYDTALALLAVGKQNQDQITSAKDWIWNFKQEANGCWNSRNIRDTAFLLWAIEQRPAKTDSDIIISPNTKCEEGGFICSKQLDCMSIGGEILSNYDCSHSGFSQFCCSKNPLQSCSALLGEICTGNLVCSGLTKQSTDGSCCMAECIVPPDTSTECAEMGYSCRDSCLASQEEADYSCGASGQVCCIRKSEESSGIPFWVWLLIGILIILIILAIIFRDRIKVWYYKQKKGSSNNPGSMQNNRPMPPRPGFPPLVRPMGRPMPSYPPRGQFQGQRPPVRSSSQDTFAKLKQMTK